MSDARLRELERTWRATDAVADEAALLAEQVRAGVLEPQRLQLAAELGHEAARLAGASHALDGLDWVFALLGYGRTLKPGLREGPLFESDTWPSVAQLSSIRGELRSKHPGALWIHHGHEAVLRAALAVLPHVPGYVETRHPDLGPDAVPLAERAVSSGEAPLLAIWDHPAVRLYPLDANGFYGHGFAGNFYPWCRHVREAAQRLGEAQARRLVAADLVPWALGRGDPLRERVEARRNS